MDSRPQTPTVGLDKDEREDFLKRENELSDALAERESSLVAAEKFVKELKEELLFLKEQEAAVSKVSHFQHCHIFFLPFTLLTDDVWLPGK